MSKKKVCKTLGVSRASIYYKPSERKKKRYNRKDDLVVLNEIREVLKKRPTYGYPRVTAMINSKRVSKSLSVYNPKRIYRVMDMNHLTFCRAQKRRDHIPTGKVITLRSNLRWSSDCFEIHCFNGEKVYVSFVLDCHDREAISYVAKQRSLLSTDIQELMLKSVERRFGKLQTPRAIEFLSDRGSIYRSHQTVQMAQQLGLRSCFTRAYSPESNGMSEAFVGTLKRDYVYVSDCKDAQTTLRLLKQWFKDYNEEAPHSGLGMKSPVEYRKSINNGV